MRCFYCSISQVLSYLITAGADVNYKDADGRSTLYVIALDGNLEVLEKLIANHADLEAVDTEGRTALHVASWQGNLEVVQSLIRHNAKVNSVDNDRRTAVQSASWQGHENIVRVLLEAGARVDHTCNQGATALCIAAQEGHEEVVKMLLSFQANPNHADQFGRTPYRVALKSGHQNICTILEDFGAIVPNGAKSRSNSSTSSGEIKMNTPVSTSSVKVCGVIGSTANDSEGKTMINGSLQISSSASPESSYDRRKSCHSNLSSRSSSVLTSSTNHSSHSCQSGPSNSSRLDRECLTFTQQLQQCSMGKNRSRPISRVLSPVSEPQSPIHSPATTPVKEGSALEDFEDCLITNNVNAIESSPLKHTSSKPERVSATINIITNPHADMMSSVEEPVWQKNPSYPGHMKHNYPATTTSSSSSSCSSQTQSGSQNMLGHHDSPNSGSSGSRIIMGRTSLTNRSPEYRAKRNGIVTNPNAAKSGSGQLSTNFTHLTNSATPPHTSENKLSRDGSGNSGAFNHKEPFEPTVSPIRSAFRTPNKHVLTQSTEIVLPDGRLTQSNMKAVRPNGLPIKKFDAQ